MLLNCNSVHKHSDKQGCARTNAAEVKLMAIHVCIKEPLHLRGLQTFFERVPKQFQTLVESASLVRGAGAEASTRYYFFDLQALMKQVIIVSSSGSLKLKTFRIRVKQQWIPSDALRKGIA